MSGQGWTARYEIRVEGVLDNQWAGWFGGLQLENEGTYAVISGLLPDQSALHGMLAKIRDLGLCLISVQRIDPDDAREKGDALTPSPPIRYPGRQQEIVMAVTDPWLDGADDTDLAYYDTPARNIWRPCTE